MFKKVFFFPYSPAANRNFYSTSITKEGSHWLRSSSLFEMDKCLEREEKTVGEKKAET